MNSILTVKKITKSFGGIEAIKNLSFEIEKNSITAIIGPNGAGKTTLFNLISGLVKSDTGKILLNNKDITDLESYDIPKLGIARTFQNLGIFSNMNVLENVMTGQHIHFKSGLFHHAFNTKRYKIEEEIFMKKAIHWLEFMGINELRDKKLTEIPFEKQRLVEIARALASEPELLLLDEPAAGLNITETQSLIKIIRKIKELGITILIVEHDMDMVMDVSDWIIVLNFGEKIAEGTPQDIQNNDKVIKVYLGTTF